MNKMNEKRQNRQGDKRLQNNSKILKRKGSALEFAILCITGTANNAILALTNEKGGVLTQLSCGSIGFKNSKKSSPFAFQTALSNMINRIKDFGITAIELHIQSNKTSHVNIRDNLIELANSGLVVLKIIDTTSNPHNGVRPPKKRKP